MKGSGFELERFLNFSQLNRFSIDDKMGSFSRIGPGLDCKSRCGKGSAECYTSALLFDLGQLFCGPITGDFRKFHPEQIVVARVDTLDHFFEDIESNFFTVEIDAGPVTDKYSRLALFDDLG